MAYTYGEMYLWELYILVTKSKVNLGPTKTRIEMSSSERFKVTEMF